MLLEIKLRSFTREYKLITNIIFLAAIMSSGYLLYNIPFNSAYALCKGLVSTSLTIGFVPTGPKPDQPSGYMITGYLKMASSPYLPVNGKVVKISSTSPAISGSTITDSKGQYNLVVHPPVGKYLVTATVGSDQECQPCKGSFCIQGSSARGILTPSETT